MVATRVFKNVAPDPDLIERIDQLVRANGGRAAGVTFSAEVNWLLRWGLQQHAAAGEVTLVAPVLSALLEEKLAEVVRADAAPVGEGG